MTQTEITAGATIKHLKVGQAELIAPAPQAVTIAGQANGLTHGLNDKGEGWWTVRFLTGKHKGAERRVWVSTDKLI